MSEVWVAAAVGVAGSVVSGIAAEKKDKKDKAHQAAMTKEESALAAQRTGHEMALSDFYEQKNRARKQRGLAQYKQFSTMHQDSPGYNPGTEVVVTEGTMPIYADFEAGEIKDKSQQQQKAVGLLPKSAIPALEAQGVTRGS